MNQFEILKQKARQNPIAAEYLDSLQNELGMQVFRLRLERGLTQQQLAKLANTTQKTISRIEGGDPGVKIGTYDKVLKALQQKTPFREEPKLLATIR